MAALVGRIIIGKQNKSLYRLTLLRDLSGKQKPPVPNTAQEVSRTLSGRKLELIAEGELN